MKLFVLFLSLFPFFILGQGQPVINPIQIVVVKGADLPVENRKVNLFQGDSLLYTEYSDSSGTVIFNHPMDTAYTYYISSQDTSNAFRSNVKIAFEAVYNDSLNAYIKTDFYFELNVRNCNLYNENNFVFFQAFTSDSLLNDNYLMIKNLQDEYPKMCIKIIQYQVKGESLELVQLREKYFIKTLKDLECDMQRIQFSNDVLQEQRSTNQREASPYFRFAITRMDGLCK